MKVSVRSKTLIRKLPDLLLSALMAATTLFYFHVSEQNVSANTKRSTIVAEAQKWVDVTNMGSANHHALIDYYNAQLEAHPEYLDSRYCAKAYYSTDWCAIFVTVVAMKCNATDVIFPESACWVVPTYQANGTWVENDDYVPAPGDLIFYDWYAPEYGDSTGDPSHVGIVESCDGSTITAIEGNTTIGDRYAIGVHRRTMNVGWRYIRGFAVPRYSGNNTDNAGNVSTVPGKKWSAPKSFVAYVLRTDSWTKLSASSTSNVEITSKSHADSETDPYCIWHFEKNSNGNYVIYNMGNGKVMDAQGGIESGDSWRNVITYGSHGGKNQEWTILDTGHGLLIKSAAADLVLDCADNKSGPQTNIQLIRYNGCAAQLFSIYTIAKKSTPFSNDTYVNVTGNDGSKVFESTTMKNVYKDYTVYKYTDEYGGGYFLKSKKQEKVLTCKGGSKKLSGFSRTADQNFSIKKATAPASGKTGNDSANKAVDKAGKNAVRGARDIAKQAAKKQSNG